MKLLVSIVAPVKDGFDIDKSTKVDMPLNKETKQNKTI